MCSQGLRIGQVINFFPGIVRRFEFLMKLTLLLDLS
jgi:hypothetical protein